MSPKEKEPKKKGVKPTGPVSQAQEKARGRFVRDSQLPPSEDCSTGFRPEEKTPRIEFPEKKNTFSEIIEFEVGGAKVDLERLKAADALQEELPMNPMPFGWGRQQSMQGRQSRWGGVGDSPFLEGTESPKEAVVSGIVERIKRMKIFPGVIGDLPGVLLLPSYYGLHVVKKGEGEDEAGPDGIKPADAPNPFIFNFLEESFGVFSGNSFLKSRVKALLDGNKELKQLGDSDKDAIMERVIARRSEIGKHGKSLDDIVREEVQKHLEDKRTDPK